MIEWVLTDTADIKAGDRVAPLSTWTLDVLAISSEGYWIVVNHDTNRVETYRPGKPLYRLLVDHA